MQTSPQHYHNFHDKDPEESSKTFEEKPTMNSMPYLTHIFFHDDFRDMFRKDIF